MSYFTVDNNVNCTNTQLYSVVHRMHIKLISFSQHSCLVLCLSKWVLCNITTLLEIGTEYMNMYVVSATRRYVCCIVSLVAGVRQKPIMQLLPRWPIPTICKRVGKGLCVPSHKLFLHMMYRGEVQGRGIYLGWLQSHVVLDTHGQGRVKYN